MKAYSYLRFSTPEQSKGDSARRQTAAATAYALRHGLDLDDRLTFQDLGVSAYRGRNAEEGRLADFFAAVEAGDVPQGSFLLVESLDRISRQAPLKALDTLRLIVGAGITLVTLTDGRSYSTQTLDDDPLSLMSFVMLSSRANEESKTKGLRVRAAWDAKRARAADEKLTKWGPAWVRLKEDRSEFEAIEERAAVVRRIYEMAAAGVGQHSIAAALNEEGVPTFGEARRPSAAIHWHRSYVSKILTNPAAVGIYVPRTGHYENGKLVRVAQAPVPGYFPAVVDEELARRARLMVGQGRNPKRGRHAAKPVQSILAGLARCPDCSGTMTRVSKGATARAGKPYLVCTRAKACAGCRYKAVPLNLVEDCLRSRADELVFKEAGSADDLVVIQLQEELEGTQREVRNYADAVGKGLSSETLLKRLVEAEGRERELRQRIEERVDHTESSREPLVEARMRDLREALGAAPFDVAAANAALRQCAESVTVDHGTGLLLVNWRHGGTTDLFFAWPTAGQSEIV